MISANELRLGNYLKNIEFGYVRVVSISNKTGDSQSILVETVKDDLNYNFDLDENVLPVILTEEILLKCGFEFNGQYYWIPINSESNLYLVKNTLDKYLQGDWLFLIKGTSPSKVHNPSKIISLHQLQNLYFALSGNELEISFL